MSAVRTQRVRDPVHGLIVFRGDDQLDQLAWSLLDTPEFQRLRRIRQLGVSEFVFPSATHTRFAHCIGVFHTARTLVGIIRRELAAAGGAFDADRLDYLRRDRLMTGTGAGAIDFDWLMEQVRVREIEIEAPDAGGEPEERARVPTFCFDPKALPAAEQFLLARFTLHEQVYFHKTTRCVE